LNYDFIVLGDVVIDIIADTGLHFKDLRFAASTDLKTGKITPGGGGNVAAALGYLNNKVLFLGKGGNDVLCDYYVNDLRKYGVEPLILRSDEKATGFVISLISSDVERTMLVFPGANEELTVDEIKTQINKLLKGDNLFIHGYSLQRPKQAEAITFIAEEFHKRDKKVYLDPSTSTLIERKRELVEEVINRSYGLLLNFDEAKTLTNASALEDVVDGLIDLCHIVVLKMGNKGSIVITKKDIYYSRPLQVVPVDTTGAGDAYDAAFLSIYNITGDIRKASDFANWFSAITITKYGPRTFPSLETVQKKINEILKERQ
jgi:ribokinase